MIINILKAVPFPAPQGEKEASRCRGQSLAVGRGWRDTGNVPGNDHTAYPDSTPRTRLRTKKDPMMMRGMKYSQFQVAPKASLVWRGGEKTHV